MTSYYGRPGNSLSYGLFSADEDEDKPKAKKWIKDPITGKFVQDKSGEAPNKEVSSSPYKRASTPQPDGP